MHIRLPPQEIASAIVLFILALAATALAGGKLPTPDILPGGKIVTVRDVQQVIQQGKTAIFDMRKPLNYGKGHLQGAVSLPYGEKSEKMVGFDASLDDVDMSKLPYDLSTPLLFYSDGPTGWKSYKIAVTSIRKGYTSVMWFRDGMATWQSQGLPVE